MRHSLTRTALFAAGLTVALLILVRPDSLRSAPPARPPTRPRAPAAQSKPLPPSAQYWARAEKEVYKSAAELIAQHASELRREIRYSKLLRGDPRAKQIALTFDDGPHPQYTPKLLAILRREHVKATFFVVGKMARQYPDLVRAEAADGHVVGDHTYHHLNLTRLPVQAVLAEWEANRDVIKSILGKPARFARPPGGDYNDTVIAAAQEVGLITVLWTDNPGDYASPGRNAITARVLHRIGNGGIILLHDGVQQTVNILPQLIHYLKAKGYTFVTVEEMWSRLPGRVEPKPVTRHAAPAGPRTVASLGSVGR